MTRTLKTLAAFAGMGFTALLAEGAQAASEGGGTLPQLDVGTFPTQVFWLFVTFIVLYVAMTKIAIPRIEEVLENRHNKIAEDLDKAGKMKADAEEVQANYDKALADARGSAQKLVTEAKDKVSKSNAKAEAEADAEAAARVKEAEASIDAARAEALSNVKDVVSEVAGDAVQKLVGVKVTKAELNKAVAAALEAK